MRIHLDTDIAGDTDDAAALVGLLGHPDADVVGVTTTADPDGRRAGYAQVLLELAGQTDIPVVAGAGYSLTTGAPMGDLPDHARYWGDDHPVVPRPAADGLALDLLASNVEAGAVLVGIGPYTNLARLALANPKALAQSRVVLMGGWVRPPAKGLPDWGPEMDWNVQCDIDAAGLVFQAAGEVTLVTLTATLRAHLRAEHLPRLEASGPLGALLARQARAHGEDHDMASLARAHPGLPEDLLNFQYDPVACGVALGPAGARLETSTIEPRLRAGTLSFHETARGRPVAVVTDVDSDAFAQFWLGWVEEADRRAVR